MLTYHIKKIPSRCLYNIQICRKGLPFGNMNFHIDGTKAFLNNLEVVEKNKGYGTFCLNLFQSYVHEYYDVNNVNLLAWQPSGCNNIVNFFTKNGFTEVDNTGKPQTYDDSYMIYDLHAFTKDINDLKDITDH